MTKALTAILLTLLLVGCLGQPQQTYTEGLAFQVGMFIPYQGQIYGIQMINFISGKKVSCSTNQPLQVESIHSVDSKTLGIFDVKDETQTNVNMK